MASIRNILGVAGSLFVALIFGILTLFNFFELAFYICVGIVVFGGAYFLLLHFGVIAPLF